MWFREEINKREIKLLKIETVEQLGGIFTKGLLRGYFEYLQRRSWAGKFNFILLLRGSVAGGAHLR